MRARDWNGRFPEHADPAAIIRRHGIDHGLLLYARRQNAGRYCDWLLIAPPLVIDEATCDELIDRLETTLTAATPEVLDSTSLPETPGLARTRNDPTRRHP